ncbi:MAG: hypothetical protein C0506_03565 [Anaerolinea sp.]|nr:hypothetical protein [Anaerolinea sp.]
MELQLAAGMGLGPGRRLALDLPQFVLETPARLRVARRFPCAPRRTGSAPPERNFWYAAMAEVPAVDFANSSPLPVFQPKRST